MGAGVLGDFGIPGLKAGADLSAKQYTAVKLDASGDVIAASAQGEKIIGILYNKPTSGMAADVRYGRVKVAADAAVNEMAVLTTQSDGQLMTAASGDFPCGYALTAAGAAAEVFWALIHPSGAVAI